MKLGFIGLGRMGSRMVIKLLEEGHKVVVWNRTREKISLLRHRLRQGFEGQEGFEGQANFKLRVAETIEDLVKQLDKPRIVWLMLPAHSTRSAGSVQAGSGLGTGDPTQEILDEVEKYVDA